MSAKLTLCPDGLRAIENGNFESYIGQVVELVATLTGPNVQDGDPIVLSNIVSESQGAQAEGLQLVIYPTVQDYAYTVDNTTYQVTVTSKLAEPETCVAKLSVFVVRGGNARLISATAMGGTVSAVPVAFDVLLPRVFIPVVQSGVLLRQASDDMIPSQGSFIYARIEVTDSAFKPIPNMRVHLYSKGIYEDNITWASKIWIYTDYYAQTPGDALQWKDDDVLGLGCDALTNALGICEIFVCAKQDQAAAATLAVSVGNNNNDITEFVVIDLAAIGNAAINPPQPPKNPLPLDDYPDTFKPLFSTYRHIAAGDRIYVICNAGYQGRLNVTAGNFDSPSLWKVPVSSLGVLSVDYDDAAQNRMSEVIASNQQITYSIGQLFLAQGSVTLAELDAINGVPNAPAPLIADNPNGLPYRFEMVERGVCITIPIGDLDVKIGDVIDLSICLNGYRGCPHALVPRGVVLRGPFLWEITPQLIAMGCAQWWMQADCFVGFGQTSDGDLGGLQAQYQIFRGGVSIYISEVFSAPLDTIPPSGYDDGYRDYMGAEFVKTLKV
jgi:hypothetical protein